ncbi:MAG TPA: hypothetical protein VII49_11435 [Rhizomicrobium sp.]
MTLVTIFLLSVSSTTRRIRAGSNRKPEVPMKNHFSAKVEPIAAGPAG